MDEPLPGEATCDPRRVELFQGVRLHRPDVVCHPAERSLRQNGPTRIPNQGVLNAGSGHPTAQIG